MIIVPPQGDSVKHIEITVQEAPLREIRASAGFNTYEFGQVESAPNALQLVRRRRAGSTSGPRWATCGADALNARFPFQEVLPEPVSDAEADQYFSPTWQASADFTQPWFISPRNTLGVGAFTHRRSAPGIFVDKGLGASATFTRMLASRAPASLSYRFELTRVEAGDVYFCENYGICEPDDIAALRERQRLSPVGFTIATHRGDDPLDPTRGYVARADVEHASAFTMSDYRYNRDLGRVSPVQVIQAPGGAGVARERRLGEGARERVGSARRPGLDRRIPSCIRGSDSMPAERSRCGGTERTSSARAC